MFYAIFVGQVEYDYAAHQEQRAGESCLRTAASLKRKNQSTTSRQTRYIANACTHHSLSRTAKLSSVVDFLVRKSGFIRLHLGDANWSSCGKIESKGSISIHYWIVAGTRIGVNRITGNRRFLGASEDLPLCVGEARNATGEMLAG